jgi:hypothetical protein
VSISGCHEHWRASAHLLQCSAKCL